ncbi:hypothetical protein DJ66_0985 [Candidatus Liberibacter solanacearum]|uniref:Uncharacterized protein n=1 Tax=Candidatus Liberibacter solanacearum TaxID=556287 RepID=A0A0F4VLA3_9HYPH|nr:hypothetical protein DJ66_0985 [Candidatus Liberibacter solanacearum]
MTPALSEPIKKISCFIIRFSLTKDTPNSQIDGMNRYILD